MKLNLTNITSGYNTVSALNANFDAIEQAMENTLSRDGTTPNEMEANLDMNGNNILNADTINTASLVINGTPVQPSTGVVVASAFQNHSFVATAAQTSFSVAPFTPYLASVIVEVNGVVLPPADVSVSGTNVTIPACTVGDEVVIRRFTSAPSPFPDADDISFNQAGTVATRSVQSKLREYISVTDYGADPTGVSDSAIAFQNALNAAVGKTCYVPDGTYTITTMLTMAGVGSSLVLSDNATINYNTPNYVALKITGSNSTVVGGLNGGWVGPLSWDGSNTNPTYGVIWITGNNCSVERTRFNNIRKVGVWAKDVNDCSVIGNTIVGNYPSGSWTGVETGHWGVVFDQGAGASGGNFKLLNNTIKSCVQGCQPGNYGIFGPSTQTLGFEAVGNIFEGCWNHGIYTNFTNGAVITGNNFNRCQIPVVISGSYNTVSGNSMFTYVDTAGDERDILGISVRDGSFNVINGNTLKGVLTYPSNAVAINVQDVSGIGDLVGNVVSNNIIDITDGTGPAIRITTSTKNSSDNIITGNVVRGKGLTGEGLIAVYGQLGRSAVISGITNANPGVITTSTAHGLTVNQQVTIRDVSGMSLSGEYLVNTVPTTTTFTLKSISSGTPVNTTASGTYTANGEVLLSTVRHVGNKVSNNTIITTGNTFGIYCIIQHNALVSNNTIEYQYNAPNPINVPAIAFFDCYKSTSSNNNFIVKPNFGTNLSVIGFREYSGTVNTQLTSNICIGNVDNVNTVNGGFFQSVESISGSGLTIDAYGAFVPTIPCAIGSVFRNTSGSLGSVLYIKQIGTGNTGWVPIGNASVDVPSTEIASIAASINTTDKYTGKLIWDTTNLRLMRSLGSANNSGWRVIDGSLTVTPV